MGWAILGLLKISDGPREKNQGSRGKEDVQGDTVLLTGPALDTGGGALGLGERISGIRDKNGGNPLTGCGAHSTPERAQGMQ